MIFCHAQQLGVMISSYIKESMLIFTCCLVANVGTSQVVFPSDPGEAEFITQDIGRFWMAFDELHLGGNPFREYLDNGSIGLKDFIPNRIESARNLKKVVKKNVAHYEKIREHSLMVDQFVPDIKQAYQSFKTLYEEAVFPPTYFVVGAMNSGGTSTSNGLIIGVELQDKIENVPFIVAHELIHFNQHYPIKRYTLLEQSIKEGSADFIGEIISGRNINELAFNYGNNHEEELCREFVEIMDGHNFHGWLYGSRGKKEGRPNDLGYWIGYRICAAYYQKATDKKQALIDILTISDFSNFLDQSGYLANFLN